MVSKRKRVTKVVVDTSQTISQIGIQIPQIDYKVVADITMRTAFTGRITPVPTVLIHYLRPTEFLFVSVIIEETIKRGECMLVSDEFSLRMGIAKPTLYAVKKDLRKMGLVQEERGEDRRYRYFINWNAVNNLEKLTEGEPPAIMSRIRHSSKKNLIENLKREDIEASYCEKVLPIDHDPREEEMYD